PKGNPAYPHCFMFLSATMKPHHSIKESNFFAFKPCIGLLCGFGRYPKSHDLKWLYRDGNGISRDGKRLDLFFHQVAKYCLSNVKPKPYDRCAAAIVTIIKPENKCSSLLRLLDR